VSIRQADRRFRAWVRYFRRYEPWHLATPGMERAYNRWAHAVNRKANRELARRRT
jgi:hypothetical protein